MCAVLFSLLSGSCAFTTPGIYHPRPILHSYKIQIRDTNDSPIVGVTITSTLYDHGTRKINSMLNTGNDGIATFTIPASADTGDAYQNAYETKCEYTAAKAGYLPEFGELRISYFHGDLSARGHRGLDEKSETIVLLHISDLVSGSLDAISDPIEREAILDYAGKLHRSFNARGITIPRHSLGVASENGKRALTAIIKTPNVVNLDVLDSAGIARTFFELAGREAFELLRDSLDRFADIGSFRIRLLGKKKHFNLHNDDPAPVECSFFVGKDVFVYCGKDEVNRKFLSKAAVFFDGKEIVLGE